MTHLIKKHDTGEYCLSDGDPSTLTEKCNVSGDRIILSWNQGERVYALESYFSGLKKNDVEIIPYCRKKQIPKDEMVLEVHALYSEDRYMISNLFEQNIISNGELRRLTKLNREAEIRQLEVVRACYKYHSIIKNVNYKNKLLIKRTK